MKFFLGGITSSEPWKNLRGIFLSNKQPSRYWWSQDPICLRQCWGHVHWFVWIIGNGKQCKCKTPQEKKIAHLITLGTLLGVTKTEEGNVSDRGLSLFEIFLYPRPSRQDKLSIKSSPAVAQTRKMNSIVYQTRATMWLRINDWRDQFENAGTLWNTNVL